MHIEPSIVGPAVTGFLGLEHEVCCLTFGLPHDSLLGLNRLLLLLLTLGAVELIHTHLVLLSL